MKNNKKSLMKNSLDFGVLAGVLICIISLLTYLFSLSNYKWAINTIIAIVMIILIYLGSKNHAKNSHNGFINYTDALASGILIGFFSSIIFGIYVYCLYKFIDSTLIEKMLNTSRDALMKNNPNMTEEQVENALEISKKFMAPIIISLSNIFSLTILAFILSLIISVFVRKKNINDFQED